MSKNSRLAHGFSAKFTLEIYERMIKNPLAVEKVDNGQIVLKSTCLEAFVELFPDGAWHGGDYPRFYAACQKLWGSKDSHWLTWNKTTNGRKRQADAISFNGVDQETADWNQGPQFQRKERVSKVLTQEQAFANYMD